MTTTPARVRRSAGRLRLPPVPRAAGYAFAIAVVLLAFVVREQDDEVIRSCRS
ncbi:MAG TPA: hypothetical protein VFJ97_04365 [Dermatophilaceae bacterium]|nr:hypothetical protein [Dermatophilaceae bacterium]